MGSGSSKNKKPASGQQQKTDNLPAPQKSQTLNSPCALEEAQESYSKNLSGRPDPDPSTGQVPPYPTPDRKQDVCKPDKMAAMDQHAVTTSHSLAYSPRLELVKHLIKPANNDVSKARVLFKWLTSQNVEDFDIQDDPPDGSVLYDLLLVRAKTQTLNHVYQKLCKSANLPCELIKGTTRPWGYYYGGDLVSGHTWCAVFAAGAWWLVDAQLATRFFKHDEEPQETPRKVSNTPRMVTKIPTEDQRLLTPEYLVEFFFFTDPYVFIYYNMPDDEKWQLLALQVSRQQFQNFVYLTPFYFEHNVRKLNRLNGVVKSNNGEASFELTLPKNRTLRCAYSVHKLLGKSSTATGQDGDFKHMCFLENKDQNRILHVSLKEIGRYKVSMFVINLDAKKQRKLPICHYFVDASTPDFSAVAFIPNPRYEYGPGADTMKYQISAVTHKEGMVKSTDGMLKLQFKCSQLQDITLSTELLSNQLSKEKLRNYVRNSLDSEGTLTCLIKLPESGRYLFKLLVTDQKTGSVSNVCSYLVVSTVGYFDSAPFPPGVAGFIGDVSKNKPSWLGPASHLSPIVDCDESGEMTFEMFINNGLDLEIQTHLELSVKGKQIDLSEYAWTSCQHGKLIIEATFPDAGTYGLSIFGQESGMKGVLKHLWKYIVNVESPCKDSLPYPTIQSGWDISCELRSPMSGYLAQGQNILFEVKIPWANEAAVMTESWACKTLDDSPNGWFIGNINSSNVGNQVTLVALEDKSNYSYLLEFKVLDHQEHQTALTRQKTAQIQATNRKRDMQKRKDEQTEVSTKRQKDAKRKAEESSESFNQHKERLSKDEAYFREQELEMWRSSRDEYTRRIKTQPNSNKTDKEIVVKEAVSVRETQNSELSTRRNLHKGMRTYLVRERMREGTRLSDYAMLKPALDAFVELRLEEKDQDLTKAKRTMACLHTKQDLQMSMTLSDVAGIQENIDLAHKKGHYGRLQATVQEAERLVDRLQRIHTLKLSVLGMEKNTMGEIRSYTKPPVGVKKVMQASFLLLGEDEYTTSDWTTCQKMCSLFGRDNLNRRILDLDIQDIHPEILARVREILGELDLSTVQRISAGAATFFVWAMGTTEEAEQIIAENGKTRAPPADIPRQREIFGKLPLEDRVLHTHTERHHKQAHSYSKKEWII